MADKKISQLTALAAANVAPATDVLAIVDTSATETKKITAKDLIDGALNGGTANGVLYLNGSKVATSGSALTFDGTNYLNVTGLRIGGSDVTNTIYQATGALALSTGSTSPITFNVNLTEQMRLTTTGLGIGTASPGAKLHVLGSNLVGILAGTNANTVYTEYRYNSTTTSGFIGNGSSILSAAADSDFIVRSEGALKFATNGNNFRAVIDTSGNLGLGVTPSAWASGWKAIQVGSLSSLSNSGAVTYVGNNFYQNTSSNNIYLTSSHASLYGQTAGQHIWYNAPSGTAGNTISFTQAMTLNSSGNLLVGTSTSTFGRLEVVGGAGIRVNEDGAGTKVISIRSDFAGVDPAVFVNTNNALLFGTNNTERARISAGGNFGVNTTNPQQKIHITGNDQSNVRMRWENNGTGGRNYEIVGGLNAANNSSFSVYDATAAANRLEITSTGTFVVPQVYNDTTANAANMQVDSAGVFRRSTSSLRYKTDVQDATHGLAEVLALRPVTYKGKTDGDTIFGGLIAEEVHAAGLTEFVVYDNEGNPDALAYGNMVSVLVKAIQELKAELDAAKVKIAALEAK